ncbi:MAG: acyltransferase family protein [Clostridium sp.]|uniref:acyltransferase family protein n=1 Tax=Clostridium sp. TaxID=1506 RepID=UPI003027E590
MNKNSLLKGNRIPFLDNIRTLMVVLVLIFHAGAAYSSAVDFWPFHERSSSGLIDFYMLLGDVFMMSTLFFIAGYFAMPSYNKRGGRGFLKDKFKILGIPWLVITVLILPIIDYINYIFNLSDGLIGTSFGQYWLLSMKKILEFNFGFLDMSKYIGMPDQYYQRYMWFLSLLLLFFIIFVFYMWIKNKMFKEVKMKENKNQSKGVAFAIVSILTVILFGTVKLFVYDEILGSGWFSFGHILEFQLGKFMIYSVYFTFGIYAYTRGWFTSAGNIGRPWMWGIGCYVLFGANMLVFKVINSSDAPFLIYKVLHVVLYPFWILSFLGVFLAFGYKYWNKSTLFNSTISNNSYNMYLVHYFFAMIIPLTLSGWISGPVIIKFIITAVTTILASYAISRFVIKKYPNIFIGVIVVCTVLLAILTNI